MKLLKFSYYVQKDILEEMEHSDLLILSFVSKKMKKAIKWSQEERFKSISLIKYDIIWNQRWVSIPQDKFKRTLLMTYAEYHEPLKEYFQLNVSGKMIHFRLCKRINVSYNEQCYPVAYFQPNEQYAVIQAMHNYFLDFFGNSATYHWLTDDYTPCPPLQRLSVHKKLALDEEFENMKQLETFFSLSPVLQRVDVSVKTMKEQFSPESKFYQTERLVVKQVSHTCPPVLRHFHGRQAEITCNTCKISDLIEFVNRWKSGEAFQKLEHLSVTIRSHEMEISKNQFLKEIGAKRIDPRKRPPKYTPPRLHVEEYKLTWKLPINSHAYVIRETDGHVASVEINKNFSFRLGVWNKTEKDFLKMAKPLKRGSF